MFVVLAVLLAAICGPKDVTPCAPPPTLEVIRLSHRDWRRRIESIVCDGEMVGRSDSTPDGVLRRSRLVLAASRRARYSEFQHLRDGLDWEDDVDWHCVYLRPNHLTVFWPVNCNAQISAKASDPFSNDKLESTFVNIYMRCSGWWPPGSESDSPWDVPRGPFYCAPCFALGSRSASVDGELAVVRGRLCAVVTSPRPDGKDTFWLDAQRDFVLVQRCSSFADELTQLSTYNDDFEEVAPGAWLPRRVRQTVASRERIGDSYHVKSDAVFSARHIEINVPVEQRFRFTAPAGAIVHNWDTGKVDRSPGGKSVLDNLVRIAKKEVSQLNNRSDSAVPGQHHATSIIVVASVFFMLVVLRRLSHGRRGVPTSGDSDACESHKS